MLRNELNKRATVPARIHNSFAVKNVHNTPRVIEYFVCVCVCGCVWVGGCGCFRYLRHQVHVKEEPAELEEDSRPVSLIASVTQNLGMPSDERDMEEELPTEELE